MQTKVGSACSSSAARLGRLAQLVDSGTLPGDVNLLLLAGGSIQGIVAGPAGPLAGASVTAFGADGTAVTDAPGMYAITGLSEQVYAVVARSQGLYSAPVGPLELMFGATLTNVDVTLSPAGSVSGQVILTEDSSPLAFVPFSLENAEHSFSAESDWRAFGLYCCNCFLT